MSLNKEQRDFYLENGYLLVPDLIDGQTLRELRQRVGQIQEALAGEAKETGPRLARGGEVGRVQYMTESSGTVTAAPPALRKLSDLAAGDPYFQGVIQTPRILDAVRQLTGGGQQILLYADQVFLKPAFTGSEKPLHQDNSYFRLEPPHMGVTCWLALDDATLENGCLHYIPGSQRLGLIPHRQIAQTPHLTPRAGQDCSKEVPVPVPAGSALFHHLLVLHRSTPNRSPHPRRAWAIHYANRGATACSKPWSEMLELG